MEIKYLGWFLYYEDCMLDCVTSKSDVYIHEEREKKVLSRYSFRRGKERVVRRFTMKKEMLT